MSYVTRVLAALGLAAAVICGSVVAQNDSGPWMPFEDIGACPFEGCVYREWEATAPVIIRADRRSNTPAAFRAAAGEKVTALTGVVVITRAGRARFRRPTDLETSEGTIRVQTGEVLYLLTYQGEGNTKAWLRGRLLEWADISEFIGNVRCMAPATDCPVDPVVRPTVTWWVQIRNSRGQVGWTSKPDKFDGKDALKGSRPQQSRSLFGFLAVSVGRLATNWAALGGTYIDTSQQDSHCSVWDFGPI